MLPRFELVFMKNASSSSMSGIIGTLGRFKGDFAFEDSNIVLFLKERTYCCCHNDVEGSTGEARRLCLEFSEDSETHSVK